MRARLHGDMIQQHRHRGAKPGSLGDFINQVNAMAGKKIEADTAAESRRAGMITAARINDYIPTGQILKPDTRVGSRYVDALARVFFYVFSVLCSNAASG